MGSFVVNEQESAQQKSIALHATANSLQSGLLADLIAKALSVKCLVIEQIDSNMPYVDLLLLDCQDQSIDNLRHFAKEIQNSRRATVIGLLNAEQNSQHENLLDWPCVSGLFYTDTNQEQLIRGLKCLLSGDYWVPRRLLHHFLDRNRRAPSGIPSDVNLTRREKEILKLIKSGATNSDISAGLSVSEHTVKSHLYNIYKKIGVRNRLEASNWVRDLDDVDSL